MERLRFSEQEGGLQFVGYLPNSLKLTVPSWPRQPYNLVLFAFVFPHEHDMHRDIEKVSWMTEAFLPTVALQERKGLFCFAIPQQPYGEARDWPALSPVLTYEQVCYFPLPGGPVQMEPLRSGLPVLGLLSKVKVRNRGSVFFDWLRPTAAALTIGKECSEFIQHTLELNSEVTGESDSRFPVKLSTPGFIVYFHLWLSLEWMSSLLYWTVTGLTLPKRFDQRGRFSYLLSLFSSAAAKSGMQKLFSISSETARNMPNESLWTEFLEPLMMLVNRNWVDGLQPVEVRSVMASHAGLLSSGELSQLLLKTGRTARLSFPNSHLDFPVLEMDLADPIEMEQFKDLIDFRHSLFNRMQRCVGVFVGGLVPGYSWDMKWTVKLSVQDFIRISDNLMITGALKSGGWQSSSVPPFISLLGPPLLPVSLWIQRMKIPIYDSISEGFQAFPDSSNSTETDCSGVTAHHLGQFATVPFRGRFRSLEDLSPCSTVSIHSGEWVRPDEFIKLVNAKRLIDQPTVNDRCFICASDLPSKYYRKVKSLQGKGSQLDLRKQTAFKSSAAGVADFAKNPDWLMKLVLCPVTEEGVAGTDILALLENLHPDSKLVFCLPLYRPPKLWERFLLYSCRPFLISRSSEDDEIVSLLERELPAPRNHSSARDFCSALLDRAALSVYRETGFFSLFSNNGNQNKTSPLGYHADLQREFFRSLVPPVFETVTPDEWKRVKGETTSIIVRPGGVTEEDRKRIGEQRSVQICLVFLLFSGETAVVSVHPLWLLSYMLAFPEISIDRFKVRVVLADESFTGPTERPEFAVFPDSQPDAPKPVATRRYFSLDDEIPREDEDEQTGQIEQKQKPSATGRALIAALAARCLVID